MPTETEPFLELKQIFLIYGVNIYYRGHWNLSLLFTFLQTKYLSCFTSVMRKIKKRQTNKHQTNPALQVLTLKLSQLSDTVLDFDENKECEVLKSCPALVISYNFCDIAVSYAYHDVTPWNCVNVNFKLRK